MSANKPAGPGVGFNHNVKYGARIYHVQTEDSGLPHAHYITHLFVGGNVVASMKGSYAEKAAHPDLAKTVRQLMEAQHKHMLKRLVSGEFSGLAERLAAPHYEPGVLATGETGPAAVNGAPSAPAALGTPMIVKPVSPSVKPGSARAPTAPAPAVAAPRPAPARPAQPPAARPAAPIQPAASRPAATQSAAMQSAGRQPAPQSAAAQPAPPPAAKFSQPAAAQPPAAPGSPPRAPAPAQSVWQAAPPGASAPPARRQPGAPLPSVTRAPPQVPRSTVPPPKMVPVTPAATAVPAAAARSLAQPATPTPRAAAPGSSRGLPSSPAHSPAASLFGEQPVEAPHDDLPTLFAEELISEKSLDEVILAFLSADFEPHK